MVYLFGSPYFQKEKLLTAKWKLSWWIATRFFFEVLKMGRASGILTALYIFGLILLHVLPWYARNQRLNSRLFSRQHKINFTFYYLKNRKESHFEYITLRPLSIYLPQLDYSLSHVFLFWLRSIASLSSFCVDEPLPKVARILRVSEQLCFKVAFLIVNVLVDLVVEVVMDHCEEPKATVFPKLLLKMFCSPLLKVRSLR